MPNPNDVNGGGSSPADDRGVPLQNLQAEMSRKLMDMETKMSERLEAITQQLNAFTAEPEPVVEPLTVDEKEELRKISASPRRYVESIVQPIKEENERLKKNIEETRTLTYKTLWERQEDAIARLEGKKDWKELPAETQSEIVSIVKEKGWVNNPASALDAYELYRARRIQKDLADPDRASRIASGTTEGSGRASGKTPVRTLARSTIEGLASTHPRHPDYKKNMDTLARIQSGEIKVE